MLCVRALRFVIGASCLKLLKQSRFKAEQYLVKVLRAMKNQRLPKSFGRYTLGFWSFHSFVLCPGAASGHLRALIKWANKVRRAVGVQRLRRQFSQVNNKHVGGRDNHLRHIHSQLTEASLFSFLNWKSILTLFLVMVCFV